MNRLVYLISIFMFTFAVTVFTGCDGNGNGKKEEPIVNISITPHVKIYIDETVSEK